MYYNIFGISIGIFFVGYIINYFYHQKVRKNLIEFHKNVNNPIESANELKYYFDKIIDTYQNMIDLILRIQEELREFNDKYHDSPEPMDYDDEIDDSIYDSFYKLESKFAKLAEYIDIPSDVYPLTDNTEINNRSNKDIQNFVEHCCAPDVKHYFISKDGECKFFARKINHEKEYSMKDIDVLLNDVMKKYEIFMDFVKIL